MEILNPWLEYANEKLALLEQLPEQFTGNREYDFVLHQDRQTHEFDIAYEHRLDLKRWLPPVPYVGDPRKAEVILLCKNGGFQKNGDDPEYRNDYIFIEQSLQSLKFKSDYPIHYLDKRFDGYAGNKWWKDAIGDIVDCVFDGNRDDASCRQTIGKIASIQWLPYHSTNLTGTIETKKIRDNPLHSLSYTRWLLENALNDPRKPELVVIYGDLNRRLWEKLLPREEDRELFRNRAIRKKPEYGGSINVKKLKSDFFQTDDLKRIVDRLQGQR